MAMTTMSVGECLDLDLPPGFRFHPTDEEIISHYLSPKVANQAFTATAIGEIDLNKCEPWDLPSKAKMGEKEWYFFSRRDRKYPTGMRTNRATEAGYWKATGKDKEIYSKGIRRTTMLVGMKKTLVFYRGRAPKGDKSNWVMHEYRLQSKSPKDEWVVCRVFHKGNGAKKVPQYAALPPLMDYSRPSSSNYYYNNDEYIDNNFEEETKNNTANSSSSSYFSSMMMMAGLDDDDFSNIDDIPPHDSSAAVAPPFGFQNPYSGGAVEPEGYLHQDYYQTAALRQCKVEQLTNNHHHQYSVVLSEDTGGVSTDRNTEISSVVSRHDGFEDLISGAADAEPGLDLDNMWKC